MNYIKKIDSFNNFYYIKLPKKTSRVYFDINIKSGYINENDKEFGVGHLLEHYLIGMFRKLNDSNQVKVGGSIGQESMNYFLDSSKSKIIDEARVFIKSILEPEFSDERLFQLEKEALINELYIKLDAPHNFLKEAILDQRVNKKCRYARDTESCIKNIRKINLKNLEKYHRKFFLKKNVVITISAYQLKPQVIQKICSFIKERKMPARLLSYCSIKCSYSGFKIKEIKQNIGKNFSKVVVTFPAYSSKVKPAQRISLDILGRLLSDSPDGLSSQLRGIGIYSLDNTIITWRNMGLIYFSTSIMNQKLLVFLKLINGAIKELKNKEISRNKLNLFLRQIKQSEKRAFNDNLERINWINYDLIHYDRLMPIEEDLKIIDQITTRGLKAIARKVFKKDLVNIIIIGENVEKIEKDKIKKALDF